MRRALASCLPLLFAACAHPAHPAQAPAGQAPAARAAPVEAWQRFEVEGNGRLLVPLPPGWQAEPLPGEPPGPPALRLRPSSGRAVLLLLPTWDPNAPPAAAASVEAARTLAELARLQAELTAVEVPLPLLELGGGAHGFWFAATDRELTEGRRPREPDEYAGLVQGAAAVGGLLVPFTLLDDGDGPHRAEVLDLLRRASHEAPGAPAPAAAAAVAETPSRGDAWPMVLTFPGRPWSVMMETPGFEVAASRLRPDRRLVSVVAHHPATGVVASLVLSDAGLRRTAAACAEADWLRLQAFLPEVAGRAPPGGPRPRAAYLVHELDGRAVEQQNGSAWWLRDGVCVHAHVSKMGFAPTDQPALDRLLDSVRFQEPL